MNKILEWLENNPIIDKDSVGATPCGRPMRVRTKKSKRKKRSPIIKEKIADSEIDLHGLSAEEAICKVELELELAEKNNWKSIRIVHGIGEKSGGVIRRILEKKFKSEWSSRVVEYKYERNNRGSSLAILC